MTFERNPDATVPNASPGLWNQFPRDDGLHVPHQDVPMRFGNATGRRPESPTEWSSYGWENGTSRLLGGGLGRRGSWNSRDEAFFDPTRPREMALGFGREDIEYAKTSERKNAELIGKMTDRQRSMLKSLEDGKVFKLSRLVEERS